MPVDALRLLREQLLELSPELAHITDPDGAFVATNARWRQALGYGSDDLAPTSVFDLIPDAHRARFRAIADRLLHGDDSGLFEMPFLARDGREISLEGQGMVHVGEDGRVSIFWTFRDHTVRRRGEHARHHAAECGRIALAEIRDGVLTVDRQDRLTGMNPAAERIVGATADVLVGQPLSHACRLVEELTGAVSPSLTAEAVQTEAYQTPACEVSVLQPDGRAASVDASATPLRDASGTVVGAVLVLHELTESRDARRSFRDARASGARRLEALRLLAGGIAHDLNNALAPIPLIVGNLQEEAPERAQELQVLATSTERAVSTIRQLLTFARGANAAPQVIQPRVALDTIDELVRAMFPAHIEVRTVTVRDAGAFMADPEEVHQVLLNLCVNARDAMPGGGRLTIAAARAFVAPGAVIATVPGTEAHPGTYVRFSVEDTGAGIDADVLDRMFEPFFTTRSERKGLGLSAALGIVKGRGGFMQVDTVIGRGTRVSASFPVDAGFRAQA